MKSLRQGGFPENLLYLVLSLEHLMGRNPIEVASDSIAGGAGVVQLRSKVASDVEMLSIGKKLRKLCYENDVLFIVNDRPEIVKAAQADGIHIGQDDLSPEKTREIVGKDMLVGLSCHSEAQLKAVDVQLVDYAGMGPIFSTETKVSSNQVLGPQIFSTIKDIHLPVVAIGGITTENARDIVKNGCGRIAVVTGILKAEEIKTATERYYKIIKGTSEKLLICHPREGGDPVI